MHLDVVLAFCLEAYSPRDTDCFFQQTDLYGCMMLGGWVGCKAVENYSRGCGTKKVVSEDMKAVKHQLGTRFLTCDMMISLPRHITIRMIIICWIEQVLDWYLRLSHCSLLSYLMTNPHQQFVQTVPLDDQFQTMCVQHNLSTRHPPNQALQNSTEHAPGIEVRWQSHGSVSIHRESLTK